MAAPRHCRHKSAFGNNRYTRRRLSSFAPGAEEVGWGKSQSERSGWIVGALAYFLTLVSSCTLIGMITNILIPLPISAQPAAGELETEAEEARRALDIFLREQRVLFKRGELALELDTFYASDTKDQFIGVNSGTQLTKI